MILTFQTSAEAQATYQSLLIFFFVVAVVVAITFQRNLFRSDWLWGILLGAFISILGYLVARDMAFGPFASLEANESQITFRYTDASTPAITLKK